MPDDQEPEGPEPPETGAAEKPSDATIARLRRRADQLRAARDLRQAERDAAHGPAGQDDAAAGVGDEDDADVDLGDEVDEEASGEDGEGGHGDSSDAAAASDGPDPTDTDDDVDPFHDVAVDPETSRLLDAWTEESAAESMAPRRNWTPFVAVAIVAAVIALVGFGARALIAGSADDEDAGGAAGAGSDAPSVLDEATPSLDDLTSDVTLPPGPAEGLVVADQGITVVPDRFDETRREGTFAVIIRNPHERWLAQGVQVQVTFLDAAGTPLGEDSVFVEVVLPQQQVAVASLFFDAPTVPIGGMDVQIEVARWRETGPVAGGFTITEVMTSEAEFSGVRTTFLLQSNFDETLTDVGVTAVYRAADGRIIGGYDTFVERLEPGIPTPAEVDLLANVDPASIAATELYPTAAFGSIPGS